MNNQFRLTNSQSNKNHSKKNYQIKIKILLTIIIINSLTKIFSAGYIYVSDNLIGKNLITDAVSIGLGNNSGMIDSLFIMKNNPSGLSDTTDFIFEINSGFYNVDERIIRDKTILQKNNFSFFTKPNFGMYYPIKLKNFFQQVGFGFGYYSDYELNYSYTSGTENFKVSGEICSIIFPIVIDIKMFSIGLCIKNYLGKYETKENNFNITGLGYVLSLKTKVVDSNFCLSYSPKTDLNYKSSYSDIKSALAEKIVFGFKQNFDGGTSQLSNINLELSFINYSKLEKDTIALNYSDIVTTSIGTEKYLSDNVVLRFGFFYTPSYIIKGSVITGISTGFGYIWNKIQFNLGLNYSKESYFGDGKMFSTKTGFDESYTSVVLGVRYKM